MPNAECCLSVYGMTSNYNLTICEWSRCKTIVVSVSHLFRGAKLNPRKVRKCLKTVKSAFMMALTCVAVKL
jgi:hypothetical protein